MPQRIALTRSLLTELARCDRSFVMSLFWHGLDNESLEQKGGVSVDSSDISDTRRGMMMDLDNIKNAVQAAGGITPVVCQTTDIWEKVRNTESLISRGGPSVIVDGAIQGGDFIVGFAILIIREDGYWEVYHQSSKSQSFSSSKDRKKALDAAYKDAAPLMSALAKGYPNKVKRFGVIGADKHYLTPYPDPETGEITVDPNEAMYCLDLDTNENLQRYLGVDVESEINRIQNQLSRDPFWVPDAELSSKCRNPYTCPFYTYCKQHKDPNSVFFYLPSTDAKRLEEAGYATMEDVLELSYSNPRMENIPTSNGEKTFDVSEIALRELRSYEGQTARL